MRGGLRLLVALAALAGPAAVASSAQAMVPLYGVNIPGIVGGTTDPGSFYVSLAEAHRMHANTVRIEFVWRALQPADGPLDPGQVGLADRILARAKALHLKVIVTLDKTPCWASAAPADVKANDCNATASNPHASDYPPADPATFGRFAGEIASRYRHRIYAIEIWNEPDHQNQDYFYGPDKPARYAAMLKAAYASIKHTAPRIQVLGGSLVGSDGAFLSALYAQGIKGHYDGLSVHYYDVVLGAMRSIRSVQVAHGDHKPEWLIEFGWTTCLPMSTQGGHNCVSDRAQAQDLSDIYAAVAHTRWLKAATIYDLFDDSAYDFGLLSASGQPKPAFGTLTRVFARRRARLSPVRLALRVSGGHLVASGSVPAGDACELDVYSGSTLRYKATFYADRSNRYSLAIPGSLGTGGLRVRVYQYWSGEGASAQR